MPQKSIQVRKGAIHLSRLGPANAQRQTHKEGNTAPVSRGLWAFPYGHDDPFFYFHKWEQKLPKRLKDKAILTAPKEAHENILKERDEAMREIRNRYRLTSWWHTGPFYSRIRPQCQPIASWYLWENPREWAKIAGKQIWMWHRNHVEQPLYKVSYCKDHLEIFVPMTAKKLPQFVD